MANGLYAIQQIRRMRGGSQAHLMRASDGEYYVIKFRNNPQHVRILVNEMLASRLGRMLQLPIPKVEVIEVCDWLIEHTPDLRMQIGDAETPCRSGPQMGSLYPDIEAEVFDYLPEAMLRQVTNLGDFARMLVLDKWTANLDARQAIFLRNGWRRQFCASFIDQGYCFNAGEWTFTNTPFRGVFSRDCVYAGVTGWESFEPALSRAEAVDMAALWQCAEAIPEEWYENDRAALHQLVEELYKRRRMIRPLIESFRNSCRAPFPNWK